MLGRVLLVLLGTLSAGTLESEVPVDASASDGSDLGDAAAASVLIPDVVNPAANRTGPASGGGDEEEDMGPASYNSSFSNLELFENFQLTRKVLVGEIRARAALGDLRASLGAVRESLESLRAGLGSGKLPEGEVLAKMSDAREALRNLTADFPAERDLVGARRGLVILQDTYLFDLAALSRGRLVSKGYPRGGPLRVENRHRMELEDLLALTTTAFSIKW